MSEPLVRVAIEVPAGEEEQARAALLDVLPTGFQEVETGERVTLVAYVDDMLAACLATLFPDTVAAPVDPGWEDAWRRFHHPVVAGGVWIGPPWLPPPIDRPSVVIEPGRAFGTGAHATTRLCVGLLDTCERGSLLDVGCGSGVLALAGARLGFGPISAVDTDPVAVETTLANAAVNGVTLTAHTLDAERDALPPADVAVANVLLAPVETILQRLGSASAVTSGYLTGERPRHPGWTHEETMELDGWVADRFHRVG